MIYGWTPGIGDPTPMGWTTVAAYLLASILSGLAARTAALRRNAGEARFWWITAAILLCLAINKELDLQSAFTAIGKHIAIQQGWYDARRQFQLVFIAGIMLAGLVAAVLMLRVSRKNSAGIRLALTGLAFIGAFVVIRATSFHHIDEWLGTGPLQLRWNWILELGGITVVLAGAWRALAAGKRRHPARRR